MSIKDRIRQAKREAEAVSAMDGLKDAQRALTRLGKLFEAAQSLEVLVAENGGSPLIILPLSHNRQTAFEGEIASGIEKALSRYSPEAISYEGLRAYEVSRLPKKLQFDAHGARFTAEFVRANIARVSEPKAPEDAYEPPVKAGFEFDVPLKSTSCHRYKLVYLHSGVREHFPGYRVPFQLVFDEKTITTKVVNGRKDSPVGSFKGNYFCENVGEMYASHPELTKKSVIRIRVVEPGKVYEIVKFSR